jgi:hypothetical protein
MLRGGGRYGLRVWRCGPWGISTRGSHNHIGRIDFTTEKDNVVAQKLYDSLGGARQDKIMYRFDGDRLRHLANRLADGTRW